MPAPPSVDGEGGSAQAYERFLALFAPALDLRIVVDVIAGASAGGVNGVMLARALAQKRLHFGQRCIVDLPSLGRGAALAAPGFPYAAPVRA